MLTKLEKTNIKFDIVFKSFQMLVLLVGGIWAYYTFRNKDEPTLHRLSTLTSQLCVDSVGNTLHLSYFVTVKNNGKTSFDVNDPVVIKVWMIPAARLTQNMYFDWEKYMGTHAPDTVLTDEVFVTSYAPDESVGTSHDFFMGKKYNDTAHYTILARADAVYHTYTFLGCDKPEPDHSYWVKIRYKKADAGSIPVDLLYPPLLNKKHK